MSKLSDFLTQNKIHPNRLVTSSRALERHTVEDRALVAKKKQMKDGKLDKDETVLKQKPRSNRPLTGAAVSKAMLGRQVSGPVKQRLVRALNAVLTQKKKSEISLRDLF